MVTLLWLKYFQYDTKPSITLSMQSLQTIIFFTFLIFSAINSEAVWMLLIHSMYSICWLDSGFWLYFRSGIKDNFGLVFTMQKGSRRMKFVRDRNTDAPLLTVLTVSQTLHLRCCCCCGYMSAPKLGTHRLLHSYSFGRDFAATCSSSVVQEERNYHKTMQPQKLYTSSTFGVPEKETVCFVGPFNNCICQLLKFVVWNICAAGSVIKMHWFDICSYVDTEGQIVAAR